MQSEMDIYGLLHSNRDHCQAQSINQSCVVFLRMTAVDRRLSFWPRIWVPFSPRSNLGLEFVEVEGRPPRRKRRKVPYPGHDQLGCFSYSLIVAQAAMSSCTS